jgi:hypothetical protein
MEDFHIWGPFISCTIIRISGVSAFRLMEFYCEWDFKMKNRTKHQCEISCSSPITYPSIYASSTGKIKWLSFTFPDYYYYACVHVLPEGSLVWMPYYTNHKRNGAPHYACICLIRWLCWLNASLHTSQEYVHLPLTFASMSYKIAPVSEWLTTHCTGIRALTAMFAFTRSVPKESSLI